ncbi:hypothetical protein DRN97_11170 [Methanosarcinales archaeon]|nr:MAG: hypothetical protein DRN97_11170 [Methanosarcinales archaeon]
MEMVRLKPPLRITLCKGLHFVSSKFGFAELLLHQERYAKFKHENLWCEVDGKHLEIIGFACCWGAYKRGHL